MSTNKETVQHKGDTFYRDYKDCLFKAKLSFQEIQSLSSYAGLLGCPPTHNFTHSWKVYVYIVGVMTNHSQLLNITILKFNSPVLLKILGNIYRTAQLSKQYGESTLPVLIPKEGQCWICNWECLYCDLSQEIRWNIAWALGKSLVISLGLRLYFIVYPSSRHNTDIIL